MTVKEYNQCVDDYSDGLYRFALKTLGNPDTANDVVQDAFERLWVKRESVSYARIKAYLFTTAYHASVDILRREKRWTSIDCNPVTAVSSANQYNDLQEVLHAAIEQLPPVQRSVILLRDYEGYSYEEIEQITGLNESQVKVYIYRGRVWLKRYIGSVESVL